MSDVISTHGDTAKSSKSDAPVPFSSSKSKHLKCFQHPIDHKCGRGQYHEDLPNFHLIVESHPRPSEAVFEDTFSQVRHPRIFPPAVQ
jgi:hypothetical protein